MSPEDGGSNSESEAVTEKSEKTNGKTTSKTKKRPAEQVERHFCILTGCFAYSGSQSEADIYLSYVLPYSMWQLQDLPTATYHGRLEA